MSFSLSRRIALITGRAIPLPGDDMDTDRIIPARFMKVITFAGLGRHVFHDERFDEHGGKKPHSLNDPRYAGATILLVGKNFGCGSSREHAPQALRDFGITAIVGESFAEIFAGNCTALGIPAVKVASDAARQLVGHLQEHPAETLCIDLEKKSISCGGKAFPLAMDPATHASLTQGMWDSTALLLANERKIDEVAAHLP